MTAIMEKRARGIFREALLAQYIDGIPIGDEVKNWLAKHGGWFPDEQEDYGYGCMMPEADSADVMSNEPQKAIEDAKRVMSCLDEAIEDEEVELKKSAQKWLKDSAAEATPAALTEANLDSRELPASAARDFRLQFAHETLQSFKDRKDRSRSPRPKDFEKAMAKIESTYTQRIHDLTHAARLKDIRIGELEAIVAIHEDYDKRMRAIHIR